MGYIAIKLLMDNNRQPAELVEKCKLFYKYEMLNEAEYNDLMAELEEVE